MIIISKNVMSLDMYNFIIENEHRLQYDLEKGIVITPRGTNGTVCTSTGYLKVKVNKKTLQVHQILAVKYFGEKCVGMQINHKDGNKLNNREDNLEAITMLDNLKHQNEYGLRGKPNPSNKIAVDKLDLDGNYICTYESVSEAIRDVGLKSTKSIRNVIDGYSSNGARCFTASGFKWRVSEINVEQE